MRSECPCVTYCTLECILQMPIVVSIQSTRRPRPAAASQLFSVDFPVGRAPRHHRQAAVTPKLSLRSESKRCRDMGHDRRERIGPIPGTDFNKLHGLCLPASRSTAFLASPSGRPMTPSASTATQSATSDRKIEALIAILPASLSLYTSPPDVDSPCDR